MANFSDALETEIGEAVLGIGSATLTVGTHICLATADPEAGANLVTHTRTARGVWETVATQVSGRRRFQNTADVTITNDSGASVDATHYAIMTALTGGAATFILPLPATLTLADGASVTYTAGELGFEIG